ncbi:uncharacterized protein DMAD_00558 [Drosophila madeirensis]|uniref:Uncharacterized protein n=1 Tax=Drosophila madeirensis TaxID=30013 RepID=A0AAU9FWU2_DROMD
MPAGKKTDAEIGKTRPCFVYVKNLREGHLPSVAATGAAAAAVKSKLIKTIPHRSVAIAALPSATSPRRATRTSQRATTITAEIGVGSKARQRVALEKDKLSPPASLVAARRLRQSKGDSMPITPHLTRRPPPSAAASPPKSAAIQPAKRLMGPGLAAKRRNSAVPSAAAAPAAKHLSPLATPTMRRTLAGRRATQTQEIVSPKTQKMYKQAKVSRLVSVSPPPTIAASRSRRSIKPNPKYASEDVVTPKYVASLAGGDTPASRQQRGSSNSKVYPTSKYHDMHDLLDLDEDNDDELNDVAYNPQMHKSDDDDDDMSEDEYQEEMRHEKQPTPVQPVKRGRGRPPKSANASAASTPAAASSAQSKLTASAGRPATNMQQLRRHIAVSMNNRSNLTTGSEGAAKRKLEDATDSPVARKRMVLSAGGANRSVPVINGAGSKLTSAATPVGRAKTLVGSNSGQRTAPTSATTGGLTNKQRQSGTTTTIKMNSSTTAAAATSAVRISSAKSVAATAAERESGGNSKINDDVPTFTIVNINDIINQDDVLISRTNNATSSTLNAASKKLTVGRPRTRIHNTSTGSGSATQATSGSSPTSNSSSPQGGFSPPKWVKASATFNKKQQQQTQTQQNQNQAQNQAKPRPRILNAEMGKKAKPIKPLLSMGKELYPTDVDTEEDDVDIDLDLDESEADLTLSPPLPPRRVIPAAAATANAAATNRGGQAAAAATTKAKYTARRPILSSNATTNSSRNYVAGDRKLSKLLGEASEESFKKPPINAKASAQQQQRYSKENKANAAIVNKDQDTETDEADGHDEDSEEVENEMENKVKKKPKYFPPETTTVREEDGRVIKKITCYETWHVISKPRDSPEKTRHQRTLLELPLVKLANVAARIKMPSVKWSSKVTLYKVSPTLMQRQTMTIFTGDLKVYNIPEEDRHKYQPSCVLFRRLVVDRSKCRVPYDRAIIFKNRCFYANIDGKHVNLMGAPETVACMKDVEILLDIVDTLDLNSQLVEMVNSK